MPFRDGSLKVAKGSNLRLKVRAALKAKVVPETCTIHYRTADGQRGRVTMNRMKRSRDEYQQYAFSGKPLQGILATVQFDVVGYDYRVRDYTIQVVDSPAIVGVDLDCKFPAYMVDEKAGSWLPRTVAWTNTTQLPRGTEVTIRARTNKPLKRVDLYQLGHARNPPAGRVQRRRSAAVRLSRRPFGREPHLGRDAVRHGRRGDRAALSDLHHGDSGRSAAGRRAAEGHQHRRNAGRDDPRARDDRG